MRRPFRFAVSTAFAACVSLAGCNAILGNEEGTPRAGAIPDAAGTTDGAAQADGAVATPSAPTCASSEKLCFGTCTPNNDPATGCQGASCVACDPKNVAAPSCLGGGSGFECGYATCTNGFQDCDGSKANGCELGIVDKNNCGTCGKVCQGATPLCALSGGIVDCVDTCPAGEVPCAGACVDVASDLAHCGKCDNACARAGAAAVCDQGECKYTCNAATPKLCAAKNVCVSPSDPAYCLDCNACPPLDGTIASCTNGACRYQCAPGRYDCDRDTLAANGCESTRPCDPCAFLECAPLLERCCEGQCIKSTSPCASVAQ